jgi:UDPglucose 6-dehydrogenase
VTTIVAGTDRVGGAGAGATGRIGVVGLSHLGIVASACLAGEGLAVTALGGDAATVAALGAGRAPIPEPGLEELLRHAPPRFTTDGSALRHCDPIIIAADTVTDGENRSDLSRLDACIDAVLPWLPADGVLVLMSQVPVGYTRSLARRLAQLRPAAAPRLYYWVETLVIGEAVRCYRRPERIIVGGPSRAPAAEPALDRLLERFGCPVFRMDYESAELTKAAINFYLSTSVTYANVLADLCEATGASMRAMLPALRSDRRIGPAAYIRPGLGLAGGNLERDLVNLRALAVRSGVAPTLFDVILDGSAGRYGWLQRAIATHVLAAHPAPRIAVWGIAYKKNTRSTKNSIAVRLIEELAGRVAVTVYDPEATLPARPRAVDVASTAAGALAGADALVIVTDWDEFAAWNPEHLRGALAGRVVIDAVGVLDAERVRAAGLTYAGIGEGS